MRINGINRIYHIPRDYFESDVYPFQNGNIIQKELIDMNSIEQAGTIPVIGLANLAKKITKINGQKVNSFQMQFEIEDYVKDDYYNYLEDIIVYQIPNKPNELHILFNHMDTYPSIIIDDSIKSKHSGKTCSKFTIKGTTIL